MCHISGTKKICVTDARTDGRTPSIMLYSDHQLLFRKLDLWRSCLVWKICGFFYSGLCWWLVMSSFQRYSVHLATLGDDRYSRVVFRSPAIVS